MNDAARRARNAYQAQWRRKNPEKVKAAQERHWEKKAAEMEREKGNNENEQE